MLAILHKVTGRLISLSALLGALALLFVVLIVLTDVIGRSFGAPLYGSLDMTTMAFVIVVFGGMALCDKRGSHICVDLFERYFPPRMNYLIDVIVDLLGSVIFLVVSYAVLKAASLSVMLNLRTNLLGLPQAWFQWALSGLALICGIAVLLRAIEMILTGKSSLEMRHSE